MNDTPSNIHPSVYCTAPHKDKKSSPPKFKSPSNSSAKKDCRDDEYSFQSSPIHMDFDTPPHREAADTSFPQHDQDIEISVSETEEERLQRELSESESLARQLMAEEAMESYALSTNYLQEHADQFSQEDLAALQLAMAEEDPEIEEDEEYEEGEMSYDALLRLGERIGDVKEERWALVAKDKIEAIPTLVFEKSMADGKGENHTEVKCLVCQESYEEGEVLRRCPCGHCFHKECIDEWLSVKDTCAFCRKSIVD